MSTFSGDLLRVVSSNMLALLVGLVNGFLVPGFLGIDEYALYKTFGLYVGYVGILHFGFVDIWIYCHSPDQFCDCGFLEVVCHSHVGGSFL